MLLYFNFFNLLINADPTRPDAPNTIILSFLFIFGFGFLTHFFPFSLKIQMHADSLALLAQDRRTYPFRTLQSRQQDNQYNAPRIDESRANP